ncbi:HvfC family RiPP maturation protein [Thiothrix subterranea]|uniref:DNA-binding domain-containing protein n=1 Tax=Thiothrix subterranea TaxID=2735563 RepID=A0ABU0Y768_9GAMM|nr:putative DNA-binding domain-containing protein [Thiothrix subterranea]MDQ5768568.1 putative DNA-binding domain-containing protein [Thiothrix subterranea]
MNATEAYQRAFAAHLRNPAANPPPAGVDVARAGVYVKLLFNNVEDFLSNCFPVIRSILDDVAWNALVRQFYAEHACTTPYFREISAEFVQWLTDRFASTPLSEHLPFLLELAHYEWVEIPLTLADATIDWQHIDPDGDLLDDTPVLNPVMLLQSYQYPVHRISAAYHPHTPEPTHLLLIRNRENKIDFIELNAITAKLVKHLQEGENARKALTQIAVEIQHPNIEQLLAFGLTLLHQFQQQHVLLGVANLSTP